MSTSEATVVLPRKASELLRLALADWDAMVDGKNGDFTYDIHSYLVIHEDEKDCIGCLAGAAMARSLGAAQWDGEKWLPRDNFKWEHSAGGARKSLMPYGCPENGDQLRALSLLAFGDLHEALWELNEPWDSRLPFRWPTWFREDGHQRTTDEWRAEMGKVLDALVAAGV